MSHLCTNSRGGGFFLEVFFFFNLSSYMYIYNLILKCFLIINMTKCPKGKKSYLEKNKSTEIPADYYFGEHLQNFLPTCTCVSTSVGTCPSAL